MLERRQPLGSEHLGLNLITTYSSVSNFLKLSTSVSGYHHPTGLLWWSNGTSGAKNAQHLTLETDKLGLRSSWVALYKLLNFPECPEVPRGNRIFLIRLLWGLIERVLYCIDRKTMLASQCSKSTERWGRNTHGLSNLILSTSLWNKFYYT